MAELSLAEARRFLGVDETADAGQVRKAYAAALKTVDVDTQPQQFVVLRDAYDTIRHFLETPSAARLKPSDRPPRDTAAPTCPDRASPTSLFASIAGLLRGQQPPVEIDGRLGELTLLLLDGIEPEIIDAQAAWEMRLADLIVNTIPRSDAMIREVATFFNWNARRHGHYQLGAISDAMERFIYICSPKYHVLNPTDRHNLAWHSPQGLSPAASTHFATLTSPTSLTESQHGIKTTIQRNQTIAATGHHRSGPQPLWRRVPRWIIVALLVWLIGAALFTGS